MFQFIGIGILHCCAIPPAGRDTVTLKIFDLLGREVTTVFSGEMVGGTYTKTWEAGGKASGVYFYRLTGIADGVGVSPFVETKKLILLN